MSEQQNKELKTKYYERVNDFLFQGLPSFFYEHPLYEFITFKSDQKLVVRDNKVEQQKNGGADKVSKNWKLEDNGVFFVQKGGTGYKLEMIEQLTKLIQKNKDLQKKIGITKDDYRFTDADFMILAKSCSENQKVYLESGYFRDIYDLLFFYQKHWGEVAKVIELNKVKIKTREMDKVNYMVQNFCRYFVIITEYVLATMIHQYLAFQRNGEKQNTPLQRDNYLIYPIVKVIDPDRNAKISLPRIQIQIENLTFGLDRNFINFLCTFAGHQEYQDFQKHFNFLTPILAKDIESMGQDINNQNIFVFKFQNIDGRVQLGGFLQRQARGQKQDLIQDLTVDLLDIAFMEKDLAYYANQMYVEVNEKRDNYKMNLLYYLQEFVMITIKTDYNFKSTKYFSRTLHICQLMQFYKEKDDLLKLMVKPMEEYFLQIYQNPIRVRTTSQTINSYMTQLQGEKWYKGTKFVEEMQMAITNVQKYCSLQQQPGTYIHFVQLAQMIYVWGKYVEKVQFKTFMNGAKLHFVDETQKKAMQQ